MEANPDIEFDYFLAERMGITVGELLTGIKSPLSNEEWLHWSIYYGRKAQRRQLQIAQMKNSKG